MLGDVALVPLAELEELAVLRIDDCREELREKLSVIVTATLLGATVGA